MNVEIATNLVNRLCMIREITNASQVQNAIVDVESITSKLTQDEGDAVFLEVCRRRGLIRKI